MKKLLLNVLVLSVLVSVFSACSGSDIDDRFVKRWTLVKVAGADPKDNQVLGINNIYFDLREDKTYDGRWYLTDSATEFEDLKGTWFTAKYDVAGREENDLFITYGPQKKSRIYKITNITDKVMVVTISGIDHIFEAK